MLDIFADLTVTIDEEDVVIRSDGGVLFVDLPSLRVAWKVIRPVRQYSQAQRLFNTITQRAQGMNFTANIRLRGRTVATITPGEDPDWLSRWLGYETLNLKPLAAARAALTPKPSQS